MQSLGAAMGAHSQAELVINGVELTPFVVLGSIGLTMVGTNVVICAHMSLHLNKCLIFHVQLRVPVSYLSPH